MDPPAKDRADAEEGFVRGFHDIPSNDKLRAMSYIELCELLSSCQLGTTKHTIVEREKVRRDIIENAKLSRSNQSLWHHPLIKAAISVMVVVVGAALIYFFGFR